MWQIACCILSICTIPGGIEPHNLDQVMPTPGVTFADIAAGYRSNATLFKQPRLTWCSVEHRTPAWYEHRKTEPRRLRRLLEQEHDQKKKQEQLALIEKLDRNIPLIPIDTWSLFDYWADGHRIQLRMPGLEHFTTQKEAEEWRFSDDPLTPTTLLTTYKNYYIRSFDPSSVEGLRVWTGREIAFGHEAYLTNAKSMDALYKGMSFPPLLVPMSLARNDSLNFIDRFFLLPENEIRVVGTMEFRKAKVYIVEHRAKPQAWSRKEGLMTCRVTTAFIDPNRGYIPLRIEAGYVRMEHERAIDQQPQLDTIVESLEIKKIPDSGFYPMVGVEDHLLVDPADPSFDTPSSVSRFVSGRRAKWVVTTENRWDVLRLVPNQKMSDEMFAMEFPKGTRYSDATGREHLVGVADELFNKMLDGKDRQQSRPPTALHDQTTRSSWLLLGNIGVIIVLAVWFTMRRLGRA